jgi:Flp pilus assembly protein TadD
LGQVLQKAGMAKESALQLQTFQRQVENEKGVERAKGLINQATQLLQSGQYAEATVRLKEAMRLDPKNPLATYNYAVALLYQNELDEAISQFQIVLRAMPDHPDTLYYLGRAFLAKGLPGDATACLQRAISLRPEDAYAHNVLGVALAETQHFSQAVDELKVAKRLDPANGTFETNLACVEQRLQGCGLTP